MDLQHIAVIGLGYVGLPLAVEFAKKYPVTGFDINQQRITELRNGSDHTLEIEEELLKSVIAANPVFAGSRGLYCSGKMDDIASCNYYIVTVPTPTDKYNHPDLTPLYKASETVGKVLKKGTW